MRHWDETEKQILLPHCYKYPFPPQNLLWKNKKGYAISRYTIQDSQSQGVNQPWEMTYSLIFPKAFVFPVVSALLENVKHCSLGNRS